MSEELSHWHIKTIGYNPSYFYAEIYEATESAINEWCITKAECDLINMIWQENYNCAQNIVEGRDLVTKLKEVLW